MSVQCVLGYVSVRPTVIEAAVYINSIGPVDPINMVRLLPLISLCIVSADIMDNGW